MLQVVLLALMLSLLIEARAFVHLNHCASLCVKCGRTSSSGRLTSSATKRITSSSSSLSSSEDGNTGGSSGSGDVAGGDMNIDEIFEIMRSGKQDGDGDGDVSPELRAEIERKVQENAPSDSEVRMRMLGITPLTKAGFALAGVILGANAVFGNGWASRLLGMEPTSLIVRDGGGQSLPKPYMNVDLSKKEYLLR